MFHCHYSAAIHQTFLLKVKVLVTQSCLTLCDPIDCLHGILQARILEWVAIPFSGDLPNPGIKPRSLALQAGSLLFEPPSGGSVMIKGQILEKGRRVAWGEDGARDCSFEMGKVFLQNLGVLALRDLA